MKQLYIKQSNDHVLVCDYEDSIITIIEVVKGNLADGLAIAIDYINERQLTEYVINIDDVDFIDKHRGQGHKLRWGELECLD